MTIELISNEQYKILSTIQKEYPILTFQNEGYQYVNKDKFRHEDHKAFNTVSNILREHIVGFTEFNNFQISNKTDGVKLRFQYEWVNPKEEDPHSSLGSFVGVGYLFLDELLNGFDDEKT